jgi:hypothetical protein
MELQKAEFILSEAIDCYISNYPEKKGDIIAAINTIGSVQKETAQLLARESQVIDNAGKIVRLQNFLMHAALKAYP